MHTSDPSLEPSQEPQPHGTGQKGVRRGAWRKLARLVVALTLILAGGEILTRLFICSPSPQQYDPEIGYSYRPYSENFQSKEGVTRLRFNALGLNDEDLTPKGGRCRVLAIGDSYTAALQVPRELNFTSVAERLAPGLDVVNGARDGLFLGDMHKVAARLGPLVQPDLTFFVISQRSVEADAVLPEFRIVIDPASGQILDAVMRVEAQEAFKGLFEPLVEHSALATRLAAQFKPIVVDALGEAAAWRSRVTLPGTAHAAELPHSSSSLSRPLTPAVLEFVFRRFRSRGPAALLYIDALAYRANRVAAVGLRSKQAETLAQEAAARAGVPFFTTSRYLIDAVARTGQVPFGFNNSLRPGGHLNPIGHEAVAHALVDALHQMSAGLPAECSPE
jgi:hypothetical protein